MPGNIIESTRIDGVSEMRIFVSTVLPLVASGIAAISLFAALGYRNDWFNALLCTQRDTLVPLQYLLMRIQNNLEFLLGSTDMGAVVQGNSDVLPGESARVAIVILSTLPVMLTYPFFRRYFMGGLIIGGMRG